MAKKKVKDDVKDIEVEVKKVPTKKAPKTQEYVIKNRVKIGDKVHNRGEKISLTKEGYKFFLSKKYI